LIVSYLPDPEQHPLWDGIRGLLKPAADYGEIPVFGPGECVWIAFDGPTVFAAATTLLWDDGEAELRLAGGYRHREWVGELDATITAWAKSAGASRITMRGRRGWERYARRFGWVRTGTEDGRVLYEKRL
jgi:hypothetical protein